ncbi:MAG: VOC family protein [Paenibacillaceae bacterium]|uniref:VOC family protein n=1 Tax=Paenibacillus mellifer TaxID=2937794 RepID=A0A9X1Y268_9BACL|nr:VOC family protein [Paenibacillus mellifer]MBW4840742.1 VOC family protein [Paenibacillaceae bacterium]MCK8489579.1 VOC family protein [Paenibacillus mellifer]
MKFVDVAILTEQVVAMTRFYETVLQATAVGDEIHVEVKTEGTGLAIYSRRAAETDMGFDFSTYWGSGNFTLGFNVEDVDAEYERLKALDVEFVAPPTTYPWGARSMHFRDPDGNIVCFRSRIEPVV